MKYAIETNNINHHFHNQEVLSKINLKVPEGSIYGFLGPNGAGKTTTLKLILGLLKKKTGDINVFGLPLVENRIKILRNVGSLIESPSIYGHLTATENLNIWQKFYAAPISKISDVLKLVDLDQTGRKKAKKFSLGMKQRLSIAIALLNEPKLLVLDEPTNGLDPKGILEMRELLKRINKESHTTILVSSHLLSEIEKLVTHIGIIHQGQMIFDGTLLELQQKQQLNSSITFSTDNDAEAKNIIRKLNLELVTEVGSPTVINANESQIASLNQTLINEGINVYRIAQNQDDLESIFMNLTK